MYRSRSLRLSKTGFSRGWRAGVALVVAGGLLLGCGGDDGPNVDATEAEDTLQADEIATGDNESTVTDDANGAARTGESLPGGPMSDAEAVQASFNRFQQRVLASEAEAALELLTPSAEQWANDILVQTLDADEATLTDTLPLSAGSAVTLFRASLPTNDVLEAEDGIDLLTAASDQGILGAIVVLVPTGEVQIDGDDAYFIDNTGQRIVRFERSGTADEWLIDLPFALEALLDSNEEAIMAVFMGQQGEVSKAAFYDRWVSGFGKTFADVSEPLR